MKGEWIRTAKQGVAVVFVHGILSSAEGGWKHENGSFWPSLLLDIPDLDNLGVYIYSYQANVSSGSYRISDVVDDLKERARLDGLFTCKQIVFVCHSMGGLVVRKLLVERDDEFIERGITVGLFLLASPSLGSNYANLLTALAKAAGNSQAMALRFAQDNVWLNDLDKEFVNLKESGSLKIKGKELIEDKFIILKTFIRRQIVEPFSGARYFGEPYKVPESDHFSIAKPDGQSAIQHRLLCQFLREMLGPERMDMVIEKTDEERLNELTHSHSLLAAALNEIEGEGITVATSIAVLASDTGGADLGLFWQLTARRVSGWKLFGVVLCALDTIDKYNTGHEAVLYSLEGERLSTDQRHSLGLSMSKVKNRDAILWCHEQVVTLIKSDVYYHSFVSRHLDLIVLECYDNMAAYLLYPDRGPGNYNIDTFCILLDKLHDSRAFEIRWTDWIQSGRFDGNRNEGDTSAEILYKIFDETSEKLMQKAGPIAEACLQRVYYLLTSRDRSAVGLYHLVSMLSARYRLARYVIENIIDRIQGYELPDDEKALLYLVRRAFLVLAKLHDSPDDPDLQSEMSDIWSKVHEADEITGFWKGTSKRFPSV